MARIEGPSKPGVFARVAYYMTKRKVGRVIEPIQVHAHHPRLLRALASMEMGQEAASTVDEGLKSLASIRVAMRIGCPF